MGNMNTGWTPTHAKCHPEADCVVKYDENGRLITNTPDIGDDGSFVTNIEYIENKLEKESSLNDYISNIYTDLNVADIQRYGNIRSVYSYPMIDRVITGTQNGFIYDRAKFKPEYNRTTIKIHNGIIWSLCIDKQGYVFSGGQDKTVKRTKTPFGEGNTYNENIKDVGNWNFLGHTGIVRKVICDKNSEFVYSCSQDKTVRKVNILTGEQVWSFTGHTGDIYCIDIDDSGNVYSASYDKTVKKISSTGEELWSVIVDTTSGSNGPKYIKVAQDKTIYIAGNDKTVKKISSTGEILWTITNTQVIYGLDIDKYDYIYTITPSSTALLENEGIKKIDSNGNVIYAFSIFYGSSYNTSHIGEDGLLYLSSARHMSVYKINGTIRETLENLTDFAGTTVKTIEELETSNLNNITNFGIGRVPWSDGEPKNLKAIFCQKYTNNQAIGYTTDNTLVYMGTDVVNARIQHTHSCPEGATNLLSAERIRPDITNTNYMDRNILIFEGLKSIYYNNFTYGSVGSSTDIFYTDPDNTLEPIVVCKTEYLENDVTQQGCAILFKGKSSIDQTDCYIIKIVNRIGKIVLWSKEITIDSQIISIATSYVNLLSNYKNYLALIIDDKVYKIDFNNIETPISLINTLPYVCVDSEICSLYYENTYILYAKYIKPNTPYMDAYSFYAASYDINFNLISIETPAGFQNYYPSVVGHLCARSISDTRKYAYIRPIILNDDNIELQAYELRIYDTKTITLEFTVEKNEKIIHLAVDNYGVYCLTNMNKLFVYSTLQSNIKTFEMHRRENVISEGKLNKRIDDITQSFITEIARSDIRSGIDNFTEVFNICALAPHRNVDLDRFYFALTNGMIFSYAAVPPGYNITNSGLSDWHYHTGKINGMAVDSNEYFYTAGSDGLMIRGRRIDGESYQLDEGNWSYLGFLSNGPVCDVVVDDDNNIYASAGHYIRKLNALTGEVLWEYDITINVNAYCRLAIDSNKNIYFLDANTNSKKLTKISSLGALVWELTIPLEGNTIRGIVVDVDDNIFISGTGMSLFKYNSTGKLIWKKKIHNVTLGIQRIIIDKYNNLFLYSVGSGQRYVFKINDNGEVLYKISEYNVTSTTIGAIAVNENDLLMAATTSGMLYMLIQNNDLNTKLGSIGKNINSVSTSVQKLLDNQKLFMEPNSIKTIYDSKNKYIISNATEACENSVGEDVILCSENKVLIFKGLTQIPVLEPEISTCSYGIIEKAWEVTLKTSPGVSSTFPALIVKCVNSNKLYYVDISIGNKTFIPLPYMSSDNTLAPVHVCTYYNKETTEYILIIIYSKNNKLYGYDAINQFTYAYIKSVQFNDQNITLETGYKMISENYGKVWVKVNDTQIYKVDCKTTESINISLIHTSYKIHDMTKYTLNRILVKSSSADYSDGRKNPRFTYKALTIDGIEQLSVDSTIIGGMHPTGDNNKIIPQKTWNSNGHRIATIEDRTLFIENEVFTTKFLIIYQSLITSTPFIIYQFPLFNASEYNNNEDFEWIKYQSRSYSTSAPLSYFIAKTVSGRLLILGCDLYGESDKFFKEQLMASLMSIHKKLDALHP